MTHTPRNDSPAGATGRSPLQEALFQQARADRQQQLDSWLRKAQFVRSRPPGEPWPAWSAGETLAVALLLGDHKMLVACDYTSDEALERLRFEIGEDSIEAARAVFDRLRTAL